MGRKRTPVDAQSRKGTKSEKEQRRKEEESVTVGKSQLRYAPEWLVDEVAKKEWTRLVKELKEIDIIGNLDRNNLGAYCNAYACYVRATKELKEQKMCVYRETRTGSIVVKNPLIDVQKSYAEEMRKFASLCGLTIDSRLKAATIKAKKEDEVGDQFGGI